VVFFRFIFEFYINFFTDNNCDIFGKSNSITVFNTIP